MSTLSDLIDAVKKLLDDIEAEVVAAVRESYAPTPTPPPVLVPPTVTTTFVPTTPEATTTTASTPSPAAVSNDGNPSETAPAPQTYAEALAADAALAQANREADTAPESTEAPDTTPGE